MSQDIFASDDENPDDPDEILGTPTEFSGVSANTSSRDSPAVASQSASSTVTITPTATPSSSQLVSQTPSPAQSPSQVCICTLL